MCFEKYFKLGHFDTEIISDHARNIVSKVLHKTVKIEIFQGVVRDANNLCAHISYHLDKREFIIFPENISDFLEIIKERLRLIAQTIESYESLEEHTDSTEEYLRDLKESHSFLEQLLSKTQEGKHPIALTYKIIDLIHKNNQNQLTKEEVESLLNVLNTVK